MPDRVGPGGSLSFVEKLLQSPNLVEDAQEATSKRSQDVLHLERRFVTDSRASEDPEADHLAPALIHYLGGKTRAGAKHRARPALAFGTKLKKTKRPFAADDALDHRRGIGAAAAFVGHEATRLPKSAFLTVTGVLSTFAIAHARSSVAGNESTKGKLMKPDTSVPGYSYHAAELKRSPVSLPEFESMMKTVLMGEDDIKYLRLSHDVLHDHVEAILDVWYGFVGSHGHLLASFRSSVDGAPLSDYLAAVRKRFGRWILDTARAEYDQRWLDYQHEIGLRHHRAKKNLTDGVRSSALVPFRDLFALIFPVTFTLRPFLARAGHAPEEVERMQAAWVKSCLLQVTLWSHPYVKDGDF